MATRVEAPLAVVRGALNKEIASLKRALNTNTNQMIKEIIQKDIDNLTQGVHTLTEIK